MIGSASRSFRAAWTQGAARQLQELPSEEKERVFFAARSLLGNYNFTGSMAPEGAPYELHLISTNSRSRSGFIEIDKKYRLAFVVDNKERSILFFDILDVEASSLAEIKQKIQDMKKP